MDSDKVSSRMIESPGRVAGRTSVVKCCLILATALAHVGLFWMSMADIVSCWVSEARYAVIIPCCSNGLKDCFVVDLRWRMLVSRCCQILSCEISAF